MAGHVGVLLSNLGTPDAPETPALRRYLREFLSDRRVIELPCWKWWPILNLFVLTTRPRRSAALYRAIWTPEGSPLLVTGRAVAAALARELALPVALGMRYGKPSIAAALDLLVAEGCDRVLLLPLYPQYAAATTASTFDAFFAALRARRDLPAARTVRDYHADAGYVAALASSARELWQREGPPRRLLISFHGIPRRYADAGDPYPRQCEATARLLARALGLGDGAWALAYQSRFGREEWLTPYTDETLRRWGGEGLDSADVICPGFAADCLETLEEIDVGNREVFRGAGGGRFRYVGALNARADHIAALAAIARRNLAGWA